MTPWSRLLREPLFHFAAVGGLIFLLFAAIGDEQASPDDLIVVTPERIQQLSVAFSAAWKRMPAEDELNVLIEEHIREEVYYRDALALALDRNDPMVRQRLRQKMEFLTDTGSYRQEPEAGELEAYLAAHEETYRRAPSLAFEQIYLGKSADAEKTARALSALRSNSAADDVASTIGERSLLPAQLSLSTPVAVANVFGAGVFEQIAEFSTGVWSGPVISAYGTHVVRINESVPGQTPPLDELLDAVLSNWRAGRVSELRDQDYARRRARFVIEIRHNPEQAPANR
jgi:hypothetical protein